jgi:hypothetical protein
MRSRIAVLALLATTLSAPQAHASTQFTFLNGGTVVGFTYNVGRYNGLQGSTPVILNCVDFFHDVNANDVWQANITSIETGIGIGTNTRSSVWDDYKKAAWLTTQYSHNVNQTPAEAAQTAAIQGTIWGIFRNGHTFDPNDAPGLQAAADAPFWLNAATNAVANGFDAHGYYVVTDVNHAGGTCHNVAVAAGVDNACSEQEFIIYDSTIETHVTATPEPASLALLATGFVGLAGMVRRKRR